MSMSESLDDLSQVELARFEGLTSFSHRSTSQHSTSQHSTVPIVEYRTAVQPQTVPPMAVPSKIALSAPDEFFFRLNKLFKPTKDLGSVLTTFNYGLYILAYLDHKGHSLKSKAMSLVHKETANAVHALSGVPEAESSPFARLGAVVANARATLRLFGLLPIYVRARKLMNDSKDMDQILYLIAAIQCSLFATFQFLENIAFLTENGVLSKRGLGRWTGGVAGRVTTMYKIAHRAWFLGLMCDFARLMREAQIFFRRNHVDKHEITEEEAEKAAQWYFDWIRPLAWLPIGWKLSGWTDDGVTGFNLGVQGVAGVLADLRSTVTLWHATKEV